MSRQCMITGKKVMSGNHVSHANNKVRRKFLPNIQDTSVFSEALGRKVRIRASAAGLRTLDHKGGLDKYLLATAPTKLDPKLRPLKAELEKRESALEQAKAQIRYLKAQIEQLKASLEQATAQIKKLREIIEKQQAYAESLKIRFREIKDQLERKAAELEQQNFLLKQTYKQLEEGINYAHHIQYSLLASEEEVRQVFPESFVLYRPMQKLSGDFFLATHYKNGRLLFIGDAEGHGIPAAILCTLMYHLVENALEMRSRFSELTGATISPEEPAQILEQIRDGVKRLYQHPQTDKMKGSQPYKEHGMDASLAIYLPDQKRIYYAGANLPAVIIKKENQTIIELEPVKNPLASYYREKKFESRTYKVQSGDMLYMFSDGYYSQLINVEGREKPLGKRGFYTVLQKVASLEVSQQKQALEQIFERFKGDKEQTDDITIVGIRL